MEEYECSQCGKMGPMAEDQTGPGDDEITTDVRGVVAANQHVCGECLERAQEPQEDDYITEDFIGFSRPGRTVYVGEEEWQDVLRRDMEEQQFWPNVWHLDERGSYTLLSFDDN
jgi:hypothetical protein